jgi:hypothetical protein
MYVRDLKLNDPFLITLQTIIKSIILKFGFFIKDDFLALFEKKLSRMFLNAFLYVVKIYLTKNLLIRSDLSLVLLAQL